MGGIRAASDSPRRSLSGNARTVWARRYAGADTDDTERWHGSRDVRSRAARPCRGLVRAARGARAGGRRRAGAVRWGGGWGGGGVGGAGRLEDLFRGKIPFLANSQIK